mmetsp:Transcript_30410/g.95140  ORF Transcript_30410/g.95140 Transcript_30410/m.95140 type:complete len:431 (+) Transcript_30410:3-1295(+)
MVMTCYANAGDAENAVDWFARMVDAGIQPTEAHFEVAISAVLLHADTGNTDASELLERIVATAKNPKQRSQRYDFVIRKFAEKGEMSLAEEWFNRSTAPGVGVFPSKATCEIAAQVSMARGDEVKTLWWFQNSFGHRFNARNKERLASFTRGMIFKSSGAVNMPMLDNIAAWLTKLGLSSRKPSELPNDAMVIAFAQAGRLQDAIAWVEKMSGQGLSPSREAYNELILASTRKMDPSFCHRWFDRMSLSGMRPDVDSYNAVLRSYAESGNIEGAKGWLRTMKAADTAPDRATHYLMAMANIKGLDFDGAGEWLRCMERHGDWLVNKDIIELVTAYVEAGELREALRASKLMRSDGSRNAGYQVWKLLLSAIASSPSPDANLAEAVLREMTLRGFVPGRRPLMDLVHALGQERCDNICQELGIDVEAIVSS